MDENGKLFRAMTWIDDNYVLEAETYGKTSVVSMHHRRGQDAIRNISVSVNQSETKYGTKHRVHAAQYRRKMLAAAAAVAICILVLGTNANVQAALRQFYMRVKTVVWQKPASNELQNLDFSKLSDDIELRTIEELSDQCRRYSFTDAEDQTIWLVQVVDDGKTESMLTAEGTIKKQTDRYGTYWEISENNNNSLEWQQENGNRMMLSGDVEMQELKQIYRVIVQQ